MLEQRSFFLFYRDNFIIGFTQGKEAYKDFKMSEFTYNDRQNIRTSSRVERLYSTNKGFIGYVSNVEYKQADGSWRSQGSRWLINEDDVRVIMDNGFKSATI